LRLHEGYTVMALTGNVSRNTLTLAFLVVALLAGCTSATGPTPSTDTPDPTLSPSNVSAPATNASSDEPSLDFDGVDSTLGANERPHTVRIVNEDGELRNVTLTVAHDGATVYEGMFRSLPNTTVIGELDHIGNYTLTVSVVDSDGNATETVGASSFDCNSTATIFDVSDADPTVRTVPTEMACETPTA
jgi:hypothetical protein